MTVQSRTLTPGTNYDSKPVSCMDSNINTCSLCRVLFLGQHTHTHTGIFLANKRMRCKYISTYISNYNGFIYRTQRQQNRK